MSATPPFENEDQQTEPLAPEVATVPEPKKRKVVEPEAGATGKELLEQLKEGKTVQGVRVVTQAKNGSTVLERQRARREKIGK